MNWYKKSQKDNLGNPLEFNTKTTDFPYYDQTIGESKKLIPHYDHKTNTLKQLTQKEYMKDVKGVSSEIVWMSPEEYIDKCVSEGFLNFQKLNPSVTIDKYKKMILDMRNNPEKINKYKKMWMEGSKPPMPFIIYYGKEYGDQEGFHRALLAKELNVSKIPVLIVNIKGK